MPKLNLPEDAKVFRTEIIALLEIYKEANAFPEAFRQKLNSRAVANKSAELVQRSAQKWGQGKIEKLMPKVNSLFIGTEEAHNAAKRFVKELLEDAEYPHEAQKAFEHDLVLFEEKLRQVYIAAMNDMPLDQIDGSTLDVLKVTTAEAIRTFGRIRADHLEGVDQFLTYSHEKILANATRKTDNFGR